jgi:hypothetical protein
MAARDRVHPVVRLCGRCNHPSSWHRHDDADPTPPTDPACTFRCLGYDCEAPGFPGGTPETRCGCPDFIDPLCGVPSSVPPIEGSF